MSNYNQNEREIILQTAENAIKHILENQQTLPVKLENYPKKLQLPGASFVTLEINNQLRGCIGTLEAYQPLIQDITQNSLNAAFRDPRFPPLTVAEYQKITKYISILSNPTPITFNSQEDLLKQIHPGIDGLILSEKGCRGTFLPSVWEMLPEKKMFLEHLKQKAGLPQDYWSETIKIERYTVEVIK